MCAAGDDIQPHHTHRPALGEGRLSYAAIAAVLARSDLSAGERLAAFSLASYANQEELAWPGTSVAAVRAGMSASAFLEARDRLAGRGLVAMEEQGRGRGKASTLRLLFAQTGPWWESDINVELLEAVLCRSRANGSARVLLAVLSALSDKDGVVEDRSTDELRRAAGMADSTYRRARTALLRAGEAAVNGDRGGRGVKSRWMIPHPRELGLAPARASTNRPEPPAARSLLAPVATAGESAAAAPVRTASDRLDQSAKGPDLSGVFGAKCPDPGGVSVRKGPDLNGVSPGKCPVSSGVSAPPVAKTPPRTPPKNPPPNARAGREPLNPRTLDPPSPPEGGSIPTSITIEQEYRTDRGRKRRRTVRIEVDAVLQALGPPPGPQDHPSWLKTRQLLIEAVGESTFEIWLATIAVVGVDRAGALVLGVPSDARGWVQARFGRILEACAAKANRTVRFATDVESAAVRAITAAGGRADKNVEGDRTDAGDGRFGAPPPDDWHADEWAGATAWRSSPTGGHAASYPSLNHQERKVSR